MSNNGKLIIKKILFGLLAGLLCGNCALARERPNILLLMAEDMSPRPWRLWGFRRRYPKPGCPCGRGSKVPEYVYHRRGLCAEPGEPYSGYASDFHRRAAYAYLLGPRWSLFRSPPGRGQGVSRAIAGRGVLHLYGSQAGLPVQRTPFGQRAVYHLGCRGKKASRQAGRGGSPFLVFSTFSQPMKAASSGRWGRCPIVQSTS